MKKSDKTDHNRKNKPKVSVIVPVWNPGEGIRKCIRALRNQTLKEIELIFIDDCGSDGAMELVQKAAGLDHRIRIIKNDRNMGSGYSRNIGIGAAEGEFLSFVDPDDYIAPDFLEKLYGSAKRRRLDIVKGTMVLVPFFRGTAFSGADRINLKIRLFRPLGIPLYVLFNYGYWSALFRKSFLEKNGSRFGTSRISQDTTFLLHVCSAHPALGFETDACYYYVRRPDSAIRRMDGNRLREQAKSLEEQLDFFVKKGAKSKHSADYLCFRIQDNLKICACAQQYPELEKDAEWYLQRIRSLAARSPGIASVYGKSVIIRELIDHGANLIMEAYAPFGGMDSTGNWLTIVRNWTDWACRNPLRAEQRKKELKKVYRAAALSFFDDSAEIRTGERTGPFFHDIIREAGRLPDQRMRKEIRRDSRIIFVCARNPFLKQFVRIRIQLQAIGRLFRKALEFF